MAGKNAIGIKFSSGDISVRDAGEHLTCAKLSRMGFDSSLAPRNSKEIDITARVNSKVMEIQVKSSARVNNTQWGVKKKPKDRKDFYFIFVNWEDKNMPEFFIVPSKIVNGVWTKSSKKDNPGWVNKTDILNFSGQWKLIVEFFWGKKISYYKHKF